MLALLHWHNTPMEATNKSPAQQLFSRQTKTLTLTRASLLQPAESVETKMKLLENKEKQKHYYNRGSKYLPGLKHGDTVRIQPEENTKHGKKEQL